MASIAGLLGYAKTPPFTAAVRRWTGVSPRTFRNRAKGVETSLAQSDSDAAAV